jgi:small multidrug resistance family-3 protein
MKYLVTWAFLIAATIFEATGDAVVRRGLFGAGGWTRLSQFLPGAVLLFGYGILLNLAPQPFERIVGLYIATLFIAWQIVGRIVFRATPTLPILVGGALIVAGGLIVTFWEG